MSQRSGRHRSELKEIAKQAMSDRGLWPEFSRDVLAELGEIEGPARTKDPAVRDLRNLPWASIDNDDSRDLDQLTVAESRNDDAVKIMVAIADVSALVLKDSAIDRHAAQNTTSVYTGATIFPMLPERLSTDLTSLNEGEDRLALVVEMTVDEEGHVRDSDVFRANVHNHAKLTYNEVAAWLAGSDQMPPGMKRMPELVQQIRTQDRVAQDLKRVRHERGALDLETIEARAMFSGEEITDLMVEAKNRAKELIEDFMIAANGVTARFLKKRKLAALRRVVRSPERWERIVKVAEEFGEALPGDPDARALEQFLIKRRAADPLRFPDLSLVIVKLMGAGEYVVEYPDQEPIGHFGLAVRDYTHSTAPNRRYPDLITQRILKAAIAGHSSPYPGDELAELARHCTEQEDNANKVERRVRKSAAALLLESQVGDRFDAVVTGASAKGTWVRIFRPPVEGKLVQGVEGLEVGDKVRVKLISTDVERGFIDFVRTRA